MQLQFNGLEKPSNHRYCCSELRLLGKACFVMQGVGFYMLNSGINALFNESLVILSIEVAVCQYMLAFGSVFLITSGLGLFAATSNKDYLAYFVSTSSIF